MLMLFILAALLLMVLDNREVARDERNRPNEPHTAPTPRRHRRTTA